MMNKKKILIYLLILSSVIVNGCVQNANQTDETRQVQQIEDQQSEEQEDYTNQQQVVIKSEEELFRTVREGIRKQLNKE